MTTKAEFNAEEWEQIARAPALAGLMVVMADRGGTLRESIALGKAYAEARGDGGSELLEAILASAPQVDRESVKAPEQFPGRIREAVRLVEEKGTPEEADEYRRFILRAADVVAHAHKEGGVLGIGGKEVSESERAVLDELAGMLASSGGETS
jgi:hypothetical protein